MQVNREVHIPNFQGDTPAGALGNPRLGIIGGGQLARMTAQAAVQLGCEVAILERSAGSPAAAVTTHCLVGDWNDAAWLARLAALSDVVTLENEFVDAEGLRVTEGMGARVFPRAATLGLVQDKWAQKQAFAAAGLPVARFAAVEREGDLMGVGADFGWPLVLKARRNGYDGKGNWLVRSAGEIGEGWERLGGNRLGENNGEGRGLYVEAFCPYAAELAVMIVRGADGAVVDYPVVETVQHNHICHVVKAPGAMPEEVRRAAAGIGRAAVEAVDGVGAFGVEMFLMPGGEILINEIAPRVHNSGHYTIEGCVCSQFENHVRAVMGWPLGSTALRAPAAVMVNLLGAGKGSGRPRGLEQALAVPGAHVHIYGKALSGAGRKMGHVTALGNSPEEAAATAQRAAALMVFGGCD